MYVPLPMLRSPGTYGNDGFLGTSNATGGQEDLSLGSLLCEIDDCHQDLLLDGFGRSRLLNGGSLAMASMPVLGKRSRLCLTSYVVSVYM